MSVKFVQTEACEATQLDDEWMILNTNSYTITKINEMGGYCWSLLSEPRTIDGMKQSIRQTFQPVINNKMIEQDLNDFLDELFRLGLVKHAD